MSWYHAKFSIDHKTNDFKVTQKQGGEEDDGEMQIQNKHTKAKKDDREEVEFEKPLVEKYRPVTLEDVVGKSHVFDLNFHFCRQ